MRLRNTLASGAGVAEGIGKEITRIFAEEGTKGASRAWVARFVTASSAGVVGIVAPCWIAFGFGSLGLVATATFAVIIGITLTIGLGIGLMALVFYSDRSGQDDIARGEIAGREAADSSEKRP